MLTYELPLAEVIYDMHDKLKSITRGYGTMDYEVLGYKPADLVKMDILVHGQKVDALSVIVHRASAERRGRLILKKLREEIDRLRKKLSDAQKPEIAAAAAEIVAEIEQLEEQAEAIVPAPAPIAKPTSAAASAGASLMPSPTIAVGISLFNLLIISSF